MTVQIDEPRAQPLSLGIDDSRCGWAAACAAPDNLSFFNFQPEVINNAVGVELASVFNYKTDGVFLFSGCRQDRLPGG